MGQSLDLSPKKRDLLEKLLERQGVRASRGAFPRIEPRRDLAPPPLSFAQERLWFLDQLQPASPFYNLPQAVRFKGPLRCAVLERVFSEIVRRHEILRTTFAANPGADGAPMQVISPARPVDLPVVDLRPLGERREGRALELANEDAVGPFDLTRGPLMRARLLRLGDEDHVLLLNMHHIVSDGWSAGILIREVAVLYDAYSTGKPSPLADPPVQYADFAIGQRHWLRGDVLDKQLSYWKETLAGAAPFLQLPTDRPRPASQTYRGAHRCLSLSAELAERLTALSRREGATIFMTLLAAFQTLLARLTGREDILVGSLIANRNRVEIEELIGFFANTLVLRTDLSGDPTFHQLLARVREATLGAYAHQDLPFEKVVEELAPQRDPSFHPLFQVMFILQNTPAEEAEMAGLSVSSIGTELGTSRFDLAMSLEAGPSGLFGSLEYSTDLFDDETIERWERQWETILERIASNRDARLSELTLLPEGERRKVIDEWNDTAGGWPLERRAYQLFEEQVERTPEGVAVDFEGETVSYRELNLSANRLGGHLRDLGVEAGSVVAIHMERSVDLIVAVLAVLKAGGACLSLDPSWPRERLAFMLADSAATALLTQQSLLGSLPGVAMHVVPVDLKREEIARHDGTNLLPAPRASDIAYIIYTSGSTGQPKGIAMPHGSLANLVEWHRHTPSRASRILQFASLSFDVSFQEILSCLASGATLLPLREATRLDAAELGRFIAGNMVQRAHLPNAVLYRLAEEFADDPAPLESLREVMVGGEQLQITPALRMMFSTLKDCALFNHYGPSESHVVTSFRLPADPDVWPVLPPIGGPIANTRMYVLDARFRPLPVGVAGELFIGGVCLARGYLNRPDLTAERFLPDPYSPIAGARMYRTADLVRFRADGNIDFLGRADRQVKIRGMRIEPGEIESVLTRHADVIEAVVLARDDVAAELQLVAYIVPKPGTEPTAMGLRCHLRDTLPEYMVPAWFVTSGSFPRTPNGKIDRAALAPPERGRSGLDRPLTPPRSPVEEALAAIWREVLGLQVVGVEDSFFELGGHSLLATRVLSKARERLGVELSVRRFFEAPTIAAIAAAVEGAIAGGGEAVCAQPRTIQPLPRGGRDLETLLRELENESGGEDITEASEGRRTS